MITKTKSLFVSLLVLCIVIPSIAFSNPNWLINIFDYTLEVDASEQDVSMTIEEPFITDGWGVGVLAVGTHYANLEFQGDVIAKEVVGIETEMVSGGSSNIIVNGVVEGERRAVDIIVDDFGVQRMVVNGLRGTLGISSQNLASLVEFISYGNIDATGVGSNKSAIKLTSDYTKNIIKIYGDLIGKSYGINVLSDENPSNNDILVTGSIIAGCGLRYNGDYSLSKITIWKMSPECEEKVSGDVVTTPYSDDLIDRVFYIIKHEDNIKLLKEDGGELLLSHGYRVAKDGEKVIIKAKDENAVIDKVYNAGSEITDKDEEGNYFVIVTREGGIDLSIESHQKEPEDVPVIEDPKHENPMTVKPRTLKVRAQKLKNKVGKFAKGKVLTIRNQIGELSFTKLSGKNKILIDEKTGQITVKRKMKKGVYKVKVRVKASGNENYKEGEQEVEFKVKII